MKKIRRFLAALLITVLSISTVTFAAKTSDDVDDATVASYAQELLESNFIGVSKDMCEYYVDNESGMVQRAFKSFLPYSEDGKLGAFEKFGDISIDRNSNGVITCDVIVICKEAQLKATIDFKIISDNLTPVEISFESHEDNSASIGSKMATAGLNTLLGLFTVFAVLLLISAIISLFKFIPKLQEKLANRGKNKTTATDAAVDSAIAQITQNEELCDDLELVAVITAAIAAATGTSSDGFVVRSIKKAKRIR